jgi:hypothetical protein
MTNTSREKMSKRSVALSLTIVYWLATLPLAWLGVQHDTSWFTLVWFGVMVLFALPVTAMLWLVVLIDRLVPKSLLSTFGLTALGVAFPILYFVTIYTIPNERRAREGARMIEEGNAAIVESVDDELLVDSKGPIGVRLRYQVTYPKGLEMDAEQAPTAYVRAVDGNGKDLSFMARTRVVAPAVQNRFHPGTYTVTNDFLPAFLPASLLPPTDSMRAAPTDTKGQQRTLPDNCFRWVYWEKRPDIERTDAQPLTISIFPGLAAGEPAKRMTTSHTYQLKDFLKTSDAEGAIDCGIIH